MTERQRDLLRYLERYSAEHDGVMPSVAEMRDALGLGSKSGVHRVLTALQQQGRIYRVAHRARAIVVLPKPSDLRDVPTAALLAELSRRSHAQRAEGAA